MERWCSLGLVFRVRPECLTLYYFPPGWVVLRTQQHPHHGVPFPQLTTLPCSAICLRTWCHRLGLPSPPDFFIPGQGAGVLRSLREGAASVKPLPALWGGWDLQGGCGCQVWAKTWLQYPKFTCNSLSHCQEATIWLIQLSWPFIEFHQLITMVPRCQLCVCLWWKLVWVQGRQATFWALGWPQVVGQTHHLP